MTVRCENNTVIDYVRTDFNRVTTDGRLILTMGRLRGIPANGEWAGVHLKVRDTADDCPVSIPAVVDEVRGDRVFLKIDWGEYDRLMAPFSDPDYIPPATLKKRMAAGGGAGAVSVGPRPRVRRPKRLALSHWARAHECGRGEWRLRYGLRALMIETRHGIPARVRYVNAAARRWWSLGKSCAED